MLKIDKAVEEALDRHERELGRVVPEQGDLYSGFAAKRRRKPIGREEARATLLDRMEGFLDEHTSADDLGLRLRGEQLARGVRFVRMVREGSYDLVVANPPYQGTSKMADAKYVEQQYSLAKADLYAAFLLRGLELVRPGGVSSMLTMRNWMFIKQYAGLRQHLLGTYDLRALHDLSSGAFEEISAAQVVVSVATSIFGRGTGPAGAVSIKAFDDATVTQIGETMRKRAATLCHTTRHSFDSAALKVVPEWPLVYWWDEETLAWFERYPLVEQAAPVLKGMSTQDNVRFLRLPHEVPASSVYLSRNEPATWPDADWVPYVKGGAGAAWYEPVSCVAPWRRRALELRGWLEFYVELKPGGFFKNPNYYFVPVRRPPSEIGIDIVRNLVLGLPPTAIAAHA